MSETDSWANEPLDSRQLLAFLHLAKAGSFTLAARKLNLSQSAVSHSIRALEEAVGCRLFDRLTKKVILTQAGEQLNHHAERIFLEMGAARASLVHLGKWGKGRLRLGATPTACQYILPGVLREFRESFPEYQIAIEPGDTPDALGALQESRIDLALALEPRREDSVEFVPVFHDELAFILPPLHPWAVARRVDRVSVARQNYVLYNRNSQTFRLVDDYFREDRVTLHTFIELGSMEAIKELVKLGLGVSILAPWICEEELSDGSLVTLPLGRRKLVRSWGVMYAKGRRLNLAEETFVGLCRSVAENLLQRAGRE